jgi:Chain length determinant protein
MTNTNSPVDQSEASEPVTLFEIIAAVISRRKRLLRLLVLSVVWGAMMGLFSSSQYTASETLLSELERNASASGRIASALRGFGISTGEVASGTLTVQSLPEILVSREVRLAVLSDTIAWPGRGSITIVDYLSSGSGSWFGVVVEWVKNWTVKLPGRILTALSSTPSASEGSGGSPTKSVTAEEELLLEWLLRVLITVHDVDTGLITVSATTDDPFLAAGLVTSFEKHLRSRIDQVYTGKAREILRFVEASHEAALIRLNDADEALATFKDRNRNASTARLRVEGDRLKRRVDLEAQLYSRSLTTLTEARLGLLRSEPATTVIEAAIPPAFPSGPNRMLPVMFWTLATCLLYGGWVLGLLFWDRLSSAEQGKWRQLAAQFPFVSVRLLQ